MIVWVINLCYCNGGNYDTASPWRNMFAKITIFIDTMANFYHSRGKYAFSGINLLFLHPKEVPDLISHSLPA